MVFSGLVLQNFNLPAVPIKQINDGQLPNGSLELLQNAVFIPKQEPALSGWPVRLKIPKINVDAAVKYVTLTADGVMDVPGGPDDVAWFKLGPYPGENGSAVITGHYGPWKNGKGSVFDNLNTLSNGDKLYVEDNNGKIISFTVRESREYDQQADASDIFGLNDEKSHLNLITCAGAWDKTNKSYSDRLIVFTDLTP
ncbi:MAG: class F sortase [Candidatus Komeilibacteria bacterium]|nr:class F sortase [Candidatus Komeilibacteria bacterium]